MALLRRVLGETLRGRRLRQRRTLREVSGAARVSLGYLSEIERGQKEASSELLAAICEALGVRLSDLLGEVSETMRRAEVPVRRIPMAVPRREPAGVGPRPTAPAPRLPLGAPDGTPGGGDTTVDPVGTDVPTEQPQSAERPLEPVGAEQAMTGRPCQDAVRALPDTLGSRVPGDGVRGMSCVLRERPSDRVAGRIPATPDVTTRVPAGAGRGPRIAA